MYTIAKYGVHHGVLTPPKEYYEKRQRELKAKVKKTAREEEQFITHTDKKGRVYFMTVKEFKRAAGCWLNKSKD